VGLLEGKTALVTGGASGLGHAIVRRFLAEGANVALLDRRTGGHDPEVLALAGDVTRMEDNLRAVDATVERFGGLDVFVGNAGVYDNRASLSEIPAERLSAAFDELFAVDVKGYVLGAKAALPQLRKRRGSILFSASVSSFHPGFGGVLYITAKHAIVGLTRQLAFELAPDVRVNAVAPGYISTGLRGLESLGHPAERGAPPPLERFPLGFVPSADDYAGLYAGLASDSQSRLVTGHVLLADAATSLQR
jgi:NAD(P)-dependent dehydrogenase (short-subunit alcohol dehydrogenase family)